MQPLLHSVCVAAVNDDDVSAMTTLRFDIDSHQKWLGAAC